MDEKEKRKAERFDLRFMITDDKKKRLGKMKDLSKEGLSFISKRDFEENEIFYVNIVLPSDNFDEYKKRKPLRVKFQVIHKHIDGENKIYGGKFLEITKKEQKEIQKAIDFMFFKSNLNKEKTKKKKVA